MYECYDYNEFTAATASPATATDHNSTLWPRPPPLEFSGVAAALAPDRLTPIPLFALSLFRLHKNLSKTPLESTHASIRDAQLARNEDRGVCTLETATVAISDIPNERLLAHLRNQHYPRIQKYCLMLKVVDCEEQARLKFVAVIEP